jgi:hypothetical protein
MSTAQSRLGPKPKLSVTPGVVVVGVAEAVVVIVMKVLWSRPRKKGALRWRKVPRRLLRWWLLRAKRLALRRLRRVRVVSPVRVVSVVRVTVLTTGLMLALKVHQAHRSMLLR